MFDQSPVKAGAVYKLFPVDIGKPHKGYQHPNNRARHYIFKKMLAQVHSGVAY